MKVQQSMNFTKVLKPLRNALAEPRSAGKSVGVRLHFRFAR